MIFLIGDLRDPLICRSVIDTRFDEVFQLAADMGGAGFVFTGDNDADILHNSAMINLNMIDACYKRNIPKILILPPHVFIRNIIREILIIRNVLKILLFLPRRIANMDGKSYLVKGYI